MNAPGGLSKPGDLHLHRHLELFFSIVRKLIIAFALLAGAAVLVMMGVTVADVALRIFKVGIVGAYDIVRICGVVAISCALPYITAVKGHIAIEVLYRSFSRSGRFVLDLGFRLIALALFGFLVYQNIRYGVSLHAAGELMPTLRMPVFWIPLLIALNSLLVFIVIVHHLLHPGEEMIES
jgi:TRAP-type C4-dicarboxylate transport system permease small subunit